MVVQTYSCDIRFLLGSGQMLWKNRSDDRTRRPRTRVGSQP
jgi:hypothetical protein